MTRSTRLLSLTLSECGRVFRNPSDLGKKQSMKTKLLFAVGSTAFALTGCVTEFYSTAPAGNEGIYVAGARNGRERVWRCPSQPKGKCEPVKVRFEK